MENYRNLTADEILILEQQGCSSDDWRNLWVKPQFEGMNLSDVTFSGTNYLGVFTDSIEFPGGVRKRTGIRKAHLHNCRIGDQVYINNIRNYIANYEISDHVIIDSTDLILMDGTSSFGNGTLVDVLDETGGRQLMMYDRLSAPLAYMMVFYRHRNQVPGCIERMIDGYVEKTRSARGYIGEYTRIVNCSQIVNVKIGPYAELAGVSRLTEGSVNSNHHDPVKVGCNVVADNFIFSSGSEVSDHVVITNCFVGQGCLLGKHYSAIHSVFFANCQGFNGEACSIFAGPFTVTHHKSTLLIAGMFSFANAGSGSNQSNHMYKLGPIHHGIVERGSKTTSDSYLLWPAKIGPFTLVMGRHYKNTDTSNMPFSYLVENKDDSWLAPGVNLRSVGTIRDAMKWPRRDKRKDPDLLDPINFNLLSPYTIHRILNGKEILEQIKRISGETTETYTWETTFITRSSLLRGLELYEMGIVKFLGNSVISRIEKTKPENIGHLRKCLVPLTDSGKGEWVDLSGLIAPKNEIDKLLHCLESGQTCRLEEIERAFRKMHADYYEYEWTWAAALLEKYLGKTIPEIEVADLTKLIEKWKDAVTGLDKMLFEDARKEFRLSAMTGFGTDGDNITKEQDFLKVRGTFEKNPFVNEILEHIRKKSELGEKTIALLNNLKK
jgi:hypothetical protein